MTLAWLAYVPVPGIQLVPVLVRPDDPHVRFHAWQGFLTVLAGWMTIVALGLLAALGGIMALIAGTLAAWALVLLVAVLVWAAMGAAAGRYPRIPGAFQVASAIGL